MKWLASTWILATVITAALIPDVEPKDSLRQCLHASHGESFWMETIKHTGISLFLGDSSYAVFRKPRALRIYNLGTHLVRNMVTVDQKATALNKDNVGGWGGLIAAYLPFA